MAAKVIRNARRNQWDEQQAEADEAFKKNKSRAFFWEMKSRIKGYEARESFVEGRYVLQRLLNMDVPTGRMTLHLTKNTNCGRVSSRAEVVKAIKDLKANKAARNDGICTKEIKWGGLVTEDIIYRIKTDIWMNRKIHINCKDAIIMPIHKKITYRGISLLNIRYKILSKLLLYRVEEQCESSIGEYQGGFRKGRN
ncbi:hypothetical protein PR048_032081 [Dryococelus australis]|uniref:Reverse transcriptase domain-containing protein n=1 Tax=Dryococelus australis TaxID=614101 RepID=A0ABQ9G233_9NEOP|nr:hypothetical protein PR048_032081 [Dryococelus australis]